MGEDKQERKKVIRVDEAGREFWGPGQFDYYGGYGPSKSQEVEPGVPEGKKLVPNYFVQAAQMDTAPRIDPVVAREFISTTYGENAEADDLFAEGRLPEREALFARTDAALREFQESRRERERETKERFEGDIYAISGALSLVHSLMHNLQMRTPVSGLLWETLSGLQDRVSAVRGEVMGMVGDKG